MTFIEDDHLIQQFPAAAADPTLRESVLPWTSISSPNQLAAQVFEHLCRFSGVLGVSIEDQRARCGVFRESLSNLLRDPRARGMFRGMEVKNLPPAMADYEEAVKHTNVAVGTVKKSIAAMTSRWFFRKASQRFPASPLWSRSATYRDTVLSETSKPSFNSSP